MPSVRSEIYCTTHLTHPSLFAVIPIAARSRVKGQLGSNLKDAVRLSIIGRWPSGGQITNQDYRILPDLLLMTHLTQAFLPLVRRHFMAFALFAAGHCVLRGMVEGEVNCGQPFDFAQGKPAPRVTGAVR